MTTLSTSVVIVSRHRPDQLQRCLKGVFQLGYPNVEVVVVADPDALRSAAHIIGDRPVKTIAFDEANISAARNLGCDVAAGDVIAFIDDDAVPEPTWLHHLVAPFADAKVGVAGGFVRGRNGISFQWKARKVDALGWPSDLSVDETKTTVFAAPTQGAIKTEGTNMAVRRAALVGIGGFDPAFRFFLDETDLNMRLARAGWRTAITPLAQVHHGFASSARRRADRAPKDLFDIGASWTVFLRKHAPGKTDGALEQVFAQERQRALKWMQSGGLDALDVRSLLRSFGAGIEDGKGRVLSGGSVSAVPSEPFAKIDAPQREHKTFCGWVWNRAALFDSATAAVEKGSVVTVFLWSPTALFHKQIYHHKGFWLQTGGLFGKSERKQPLVNFKRLKKRYSLEVGRIAVVREVKKTLT
ncbi:MAG: glycosyltransferase [Rhodobacteraceae bacterium]|nr:glycosyltransferase [Paracoccaceae bacterium]